MKMNRWESHNIPVINCNTIDIPSKKPIFQKELMLLGHGYDCKWDLIRNR